MLKIYNDCPICGNELKYYFGYSIFFSCQSINAKYFLQIESESYLFPYLYLYYNEFQISFNKNLTILNKNRSQISLNYILPFDKILSPAYLENKFKNLLPLL